jgi:hypothetical protein
LERSSLGEGGLRRFCGKGRSLQAKKSCSRRFDRGHHGDRRYRIEGDTTATTALAFLVAEEITTVDNLGNVNGAPLSVYLMTGTLTGLLGNRILQPSGRRSIQWLSPRAAVAEALACQGIR